MSHKAVWAKTREPHAGPSAPSLARNHCGTRTTGLLPYSTAVPRQEWHDPCRCKGEGCCCACWWWSRLRVSSSQSCCTRPLERPSSFIPTWLGVGVVLGLGVGLRGQGQGRG
eukprot:scaffold6999_cov60-Phaeocystis_antarctica.AAC.3